MSPFFLHRRAHHATLRVNADLHHAVSDEAVWRHFEIQRRGHVLEDAAGQIELRAVARAVEATRPVGAELGVRGLEAAQRRATEVRAHAHQHQVLGLERAAPHSLRTWAGRTVPTSGRAGDRPAPGFELLQHFRRAAHDEDGLAAPGHLDHGARLELADVLLYRRAQRLRASTRLQDARNGTAVIAAPAIPVTVVATSKKWRRPPSTPSSLDLPTSDVIHSSPRGIYRTRNLTEPLKPSEVSNVQGIPHYTHIAQRAMKRPGHRRYSYSSRHRAHRAADPVVPAEMDLGGPRHRRRPAAGSARRRPGPSAAPATQESPSAPGILHAARRRSAQVFCRCGRPRRPGRS